MTDRQFLIQSLQLIPHPILCLLYTSVRKTIGGITYNATFRIEWVDSMKQTPKLSGKDTICSNNKKYKVSVKKVKDAVKYVWFVNPNSAGVISDTDSVATITPDPAFSGKIQIRALAIFDPMSFMVSQMSFPVDLNIIQGPVSGFDAATDATKKVDFTNTSGNATSYVLKYGDATADYTGTTFTTLSHTYAATGNQSVTLIATIGTCSDTLVKTVNVGRIALYDEAGRVSFYPNPAAETMTVDIQQDGTSPYKIISINGQTVQSGIITSSLSVIDVSGLIPGAYLLRVGNKTVSFIKK